MTTATFTAQGWVEKNLTNKDIKQIKLSPLTPEQEWNAEAIAVGGILIGDLIIRDFPQLEEIGLREHALTSLTVINCPQLTHINVRYNKLTKLDIEETKLDQEKSVDNQIREIIIGSNEIQTLNLTTCPQLKRLIAPDNPNLTGIKNLNFKSINDINLANSPHVSLVTDYEELKQKNKRLWKTLNAVNEAGLQKKLVLSEPIRTVKQSEEAIRQLLKDAEREWLEYFMSEDPNIARKKFLLGLSFQFPERRKRAKEILPLIMKVQEEKDYQSLARESSLLVKEWNGGKEYNEEHDYDGSLGNLIELLKFKE